MAGVLLTVMGSATLASPLYSLYREAYQVGPGSVAMAYSAYMAGALLALIGLARLSDQWGYARTLLLAVVAAALGLVASAIAESICALSVGRFLIGLGAGVAASAATAGIVNAAGPRGAPGASAMAAVLSTLGLGLGPIIAGVAAQFLPFPLVTVYALLAAVAVILAIQLWPEAAGASSVKLSLQQLRPSFHLPAKEHIAQFMLLGTLTFVGYALFSLFASLAPSYLAELLDLHGPLIEGLGVAALFGGSVAAQLLLRKAESRQGVVTGAALMAVSLLMLASALQMSSAALFIASDLLGGVGQGLAFMSAIRLVSPMSPSELRGGLMASFFSMAYLGGTVPLLLTGLIARWVGTTNAVILFSITLGGAAAALWYLLLRRLKQSQ